MENFLILSKIIFPTYLGGILDGKYYFSKNFNKFFTKTYVKNSKKPNFLISSNSLIAGCEPSRLLVEII